MANIIVFEVQLIPDFDPTQIQPDEGDYFTYGPTIQADPHTQDTDLADKILDVDFTRRGSWNDLPSVEEKRRRIIAAIDYIETHYRLIGEKLDPDQPREWPRSVFSVADVDPTKRMDVPMDYFRACVLLAGSIAVDPSTTNPTISTNNIKRDKTGPLETEFFHPNALPTDLPVQDSDILNLLEPFLAGDESDVGGVSYIGPSNTSVEYNLITKKQRYW